VGGYTCVKDGVTLSDAIYYSEKQCTDKGGEPSAYTCGVSESYTKSINSCETVKPVM